MFRSASTTGGDAFARGRRSGSGVTILGLLTLAAAALDGVALAGAERLLGALAALL